VLRPKTLIPDAQVTADHTLVCNWNELAVPLLRHIAVAKAKNVEAYSGGWGGGLSVLSLRLLHDACSRGKIASHAMRTVSHCFQARLPLCSTRSLCRTLCVGLICFLGLPVFLCFGHRRLRVGAHLTMSTSLSAAVPKPLNPAGCSLSYLIGRIRQLARIW
jgi:hypothetical protein